LALVGVAGEGLVGLLFARLMSPTEWRDLLPLFESKAVKSERRRSIRQGRLADVEQNDSLP